MEVSKEKLTKSVNEKRSSKKQVKKRRFRERKGNRWKSQELGGEESAAPSKKIRKSSPGPRSKRKRG